MKGTIQKRGRDSWRLKFDLGRDPLTGKRLTTYQTFRGSRRAAETELARLITAAENAVFVKPDRLTVAEFLDRWIRDWAALHVSPKTRERYAELLNNHVRPHLGAAAVQKLRPVTLSELYAKLLREGRGGAGGLAPRTVGHVHRVLHRALGHAVQWGLIVQNPAGAVDPPPVEAAEVEILDADQVVDVMQKLRGRALYPIIATMLATGMRRGEALALRWRDVDLDGSKIRVERSIEQTKPDPAASTDLGQRGLRFKAPKTKHGRRTIALPASTVADLRAHRVAQQEHRLALGMGKATTDALVFPAWDGEPRSPNATTREWRRAVAELGLPPVTLHGLRHTHASQLIAAGVDVLTISRRLGHGSPTITLGVYGHLFSNTDDRAAQVIEATMVRTRAD